MSVHEKMAMWGPLVHDENPDHDLLSINEPIYLPGSPVRIDLETESEVDDENVELPIYGKVITESKAYRWLLDTISKQSSLLWSDFEPNIMNDEIRRAILRRLPKSQISCSRAPSTFTATLRLPWLPLLERMRQETFQRGSLIHCLDLASIVTLTGTFKDNIQALSVRDYFEQTWADGGIRLLEALQRLLDLELGYRSRTGNESTQTPAPGTVRTRGAECRLRVQPPYLEVTTTGSADSIATCGEQLAWLASALYPLGAAPIRCQTCIEETRDLIFSLSTKAEHVDSASDILDSGLTRIWHERFSAPCVSIGFPIACRPDDFRGWEIPWPQLMALVQISQQDFPLAGHEAGVFRLHGHSVRLDLAKVAHGTAMWHIHDMQVRASDCRQSYCGDQGFQFDSRSLPETMQSYRHIVGTCREKLPPDATTPRKDKEETSETHHLSLEQIGLANYSTSETSERSSRSISVDPEMMSYSGGSESSAVRDDIDIEDDHFRALLTEVRDCLLSSFRCSWYANKNSPTDGGGSDGQKTEGSSSSSSTSQARTTITPTGSRHLQKRKLDSYKDGDGRDDDGFMIPPVKKLKHNPDHQAQKIFACPYWKASPNGYRPCFKLELRDVSRVKQHLNRSHAPKFYCPRCWLTFKRGETYNAHIMRPSSTMCAPNPLARLEGLSHEQRDRLSCRTGLASMPEFDKWFAVWDIVFPGTQRPSSPYLDGQLSEDCLSFQEHVARDGPSILLRVLESRGALASTWSARRDRESILSRALVDGISLMVETWSQPQDPSPINATGAASMPCSGTEESPNSSQPDSGVVVTGYGSEDRLQQSQQLCMQEEPVAQHATSTGNHDIDDFFSGREQHIAANDEATLENCVTSEAQYFQDALLPYDLEAELQTFMGASELDLSSFDQAETAGWDGFDFLDSNHYEQANGCGDNGAT